VVFLVERQAEQRTGSSAEQSTSTGSETAPVRTMHTLFPGSGKRLISAVIALKRTEACRGTCSSRRSAASSEREEEDR
jgi:hypothetical protein